jgi:outer membrane protein
MTFKIFAAATLAGVAATALSTAAFAQAPAAPAAAAPAAPAVTHGTAPPAVCIFNSQAAVATSTVGKFVDTRMKQIVGVVNAELTTERTAIENEAKAIDAGKATLQPDVLEKRSSDLQVRYNAFQRKGQQRQREIETTEQKAYNRVATELDPMVRTAYQQKGCALLLDRQAVLLGNPTMDITPAVVTALNAKITQFTFDRERLDAAAGAAAPAAAPR